MLDVLFSLTTIITLIIIAAGGAFYVASKLTNLYIVVKPYKLPLELVGIAIFSYGMLLYGGKASEQKWEERVAEAQVKVAAAEARSQEVNTVVQEKVVTKIVKIKDNSDATIKEIKSNAPQIDSKCTMLDSSVLLLNSASKNEVPGSTTGTNGTTTAVEANRVEEKSTVKASDVLEVVVENYATCNVIREKLIAWQEWYRAQQKAYQ
jgi:hypothetical protein